MEEVILVDENDHERGICEKMEAHRKGLLHRAVSVVIFNSKGEMLIQKRAKEKYHCPGLWANACCTHPRKREENNLCAKRRLFEEIGIECELDKVFSFIYRKKFENGLIENELDHVFVGKFDGKYEINREEVFEARWISIEDLKEDIEKNKDKYCYWFLKILEKEIIRNFR